MQSRQSRGISTQRPRPPEEHVEHRGPVDALHDQLRAASADVLDPRRGKAARGDVLHDLGLALHGAPETGAAHDEPGTVREDVRVAARRGGKARSGAAAALPFWYSATPLRVTPITGAIARAACITTARFMSSICDRSFKVSALAASCFRRRGAISPRAA